MRPAPSTLPALSLFVVLLLLLAPVAHALKADPDPADPWRKVRVAWEDAAAAPEVLRGTEPMGVEQGAWIDLLARDAELERLDAAGVPYVVIEADLQARAEGLSRGPNFGIFHTYSETEDFLDSLHAAHPDITTEKISLGTSWEGRPIWAMKISDQPDVDDPDEPEVLFDALHHAREVITVEVVLNTMAWLCSGYGIDPDATALVDERETWFVPIVNPDGFVWNETTNPSGGGMWRKNRRDNSGSCEGVDLNRNYPYQWGLNSGSSPYECDDDYRGPEAASEPETQVMMSFIESREFVTHNSYHSVVGCVLIPWGYTSSPLTPDDALFRTMGDEMARDSGYPVGTAYEMILYTASGGMFDWAYGDQTTKPKIFAFTTEVDGTSFWPAESERNGLVAENLYSDIFLMRAAGVWLGLDGFTLVEPGGNGRLDPGETLDLVVSVRNFGVLADAAGVTVTVASDDPYLAFGAAQATVGAIPAGTVEDHSTEPFVVTADPATPLGHVADLVVTVEDADGFSVTETLALTVGLAPALYATDFEADDGGWSPDPTHTASTGSFVRIDPNPTGWQPGDDTTPAPGVYAWVTGQNTSDGVNDVDGGVAATRSPTIDCSGVPTARLTMSWFHGQRDAGDDTGDFFRIAVSSDGGVTWPVDLVSIGDVTRTADWTALTADLEDHVALTGGIRLRVQAADGVATGDIVEAGIDDVRVAVAGSGNEAPGAPALASPADGASGLPPTPVLALTNAVDPEGDALTYTFRVYADALLTQEVAAATGVVAGAGTTDWTVDPPLAEGTYWWRAHAADAELRGPYASSRSFDVVAPTDAAVLAGGVGVPRLAAPRPNPSADGADVAFALPGRARVRIDVFDLHGRHVRRLFEGVAEAGPHVRRWDGLDAGGSRVAGGVYFVQMQVGGERQTRKLVRLP